MEVKENALESQKDKVYFIDEFQIPVNSMKAFTQRMEYNRTFIKGIDGFIKDQVFERRDEEGNFIIITIASWKSKDHLEDAKSKVQAEYKRINFDPSEFCRQLNIKMKRGLYHKN
ncbi:hypothetical protein [Pedobacter metabolipauper]|nr:hypothetical protein [Pedobacter metabolipauper]